MTIIAILCFLLIFSGSAIHAECAGTSLLPTMPPEDRAAIEARVADLPYARGNSWLASRGEESVRLVGTYHLDDPRHDAVFERMAADIDGASVVLVEAGPEEETRLKSDMTSNPALLFRTEGPTLPEQLPEADWQALNVAMNARGIPGFLVAKMQPWYVSMMLGIPPCAIEEVNSGEKGLDARIIDRAEGKGIPIRALEPYDTIFSLFSGMSEDAKLEMIRAGLAMDKQAEDYGATLADAYFAENARLTWELGRLASYKLPGQTPEEVDADMAEMEEALMFSRNRAWIPVIEAAAAEGPVFAAFGALHLSGEDGVLALLEREGFTIERQPF
ncbi:TraB/GumN family protein [Defluviimonas sp. WL0050]|uniref:TraB/GumN family protein n=1 Tax=Albidovulum litorale TaxID=2984134 RepID=A0ABT2ZTA6_9RHOB|nr:TraB/GumN family protein [Defluviimonas sp. WL0050]MCV2874362.1 TraB/GumN family protein [Defluviimonas sp. WL0050]